MAFKIRELAKVQRYDLAAQCLKFSGGRTDQPEKLAPREAWKLIEMFKAAASREASHRFTEDRSQPALFPN
jgi:hypothetical protein